MKTARVKVLDFIESHQVVSASDISLALKMTSSNARHHIQILHSLGLLEIAGERTSGGRGRPMQLYRLANQASGENFKRLTHALLSTLLTKLGEEEYTDSLQTAATKIISSTPLGEFMIVHNGGPSKLSQRLVMAINILNQLNYQARWEAHLNGPQIFLGNCPYQALLKQHPELCQMDLYLLEEITSNKIKQISRLSKDPSGNVFCLFRLLL